MGIDNGVKDACATDSARWQAVANRDSAADGRFVYAVSTTGIYCRPGCSARLARREHVSFFDTCEAAESAGFRPCKRCRPEGAGVVERQGEAVARACRLLEDAEVFPSLETLSAAVGMSPHHFHRLFKAQTGVTPRAYGAARRSARSGSERASAARVQSPRLSTKPASMPTAVSMNRARTCWA